MSKKCKNVARSRQSAYSLYNMRFNNERATRRGVAQQLKERATRRNVTQQLIIQSIHEKVKKHKLYDGNMIKCVMNRCIMNVDILPKRWRLNDSLNDVQEGDIVKLNYIMMDLAFIRRVKEETVIEKLLSDRIEKLLSEQNL